MRLRYLLLLLLAAVVGSALFLYGRSQEKKEVFDIILIPKVIDCDSDFWTQLIDGAYMAAEEYHVRLRMAAPEEESDYKRQNELIRWAISEKPDAILLAPISYAENSQAVQMIVENKIKLILVDSDVDIKVQETIIATNNVLAGAAEGAYIKELLDENSQIAIIGHVKGSSTAMEREKGLREGLGEMADRIVDVVYCDSDYNKAYELMMELMETYPDINVVAGLNEYSAVGAARAIRDMNKADEIQVVGFDSSLEEIQMLEEGLFRGIVIQKSFKMGYLGIQAAVTILEGKSVPADIDSGYELITQENLYLEEYQKQLFPFREE